MAVYLDYCASAPLDSRVLELMVHIYRDMPGNADSRTHLFGAKAREIVVKSRNTLAEVLQVDPSEILFTSGATESDNAAILGLRDFGEESHRKHIITTAIEHKAVLEPARFLQRAGFEVDFVRPDEDGRVDPGQILSRVRKDTLLVSVMHVNNETGIIQPVQEIGEELWKKRVLFHVDAAQSFGKLNSELRTLKYDLLSVSGHKIHGPQGVGLLVTRRRNYRRPPITPLLRGGQQEYGFRPGTSPVALIAGLAEAARLMDQEYPLLRERLLQTKKNLLAMLGRYGARANGNQDFALPCVLNVSVPGMDAEAFFAAQKENYAVSSGSACNSGSYAPSYVLEAMGLDALRISEALRVSWWTEPFDLHAFEDYIRDCR